MDGYLVCFAIVGESGDPLSPQGRSLGFAEAEQDLIRVAAQVCGERRFRAVILGVGEDVALVDVDETRRLGCCQHMRRIDPVKRLR